MCTGWIITIAASLVSLNYFSAIYQSTHLAGIIGGIKMIDREFAVICLCAFAAMLWGLLDDKKPMRASVKFAGQLVIALLIVCVGNIRISCFIDNCFITGALTVCWLLFLLN